MGRTTNALLCAAAVSLVVALPLAYAGNRTHAAAGAGGCTVSGNTVEGWGLPTDAVVNFFFTDADGKYSWALGYTESSFSVTVPDRDGPTTYEFASTTFGKNGSKYWVYASCSAS